MALSIFDEAFQTGDYTTVVQGLLAKKDSPDFAEILTSALTCMALAGFAQGADPEAVSKIAAGIKRISKFVGG